MKIIMEALKNTYKKLDKHKEAGILSETFLGDELAPIQDYFLDSYVFPKDNTVEMREKYGDKWFEKEECFCRDYLEDVLSEYFDGLITFEEMDLKLKGYLKDLENNKTLLGFDLIKYA